MPNKNPTAQDDEPYCRNCGYPLKGLVDSSKCPECGRPMVEVLVRDAFPGQRGYRYQSVRRMWGLPLVSIAYGPHGSERMGHPVGVIAIGDVPKGVIAIGGWPIGVVAIGGFTLGVISFGGFSAGIVAIGGFAAGAAAFGGFALGLYSAGGFAFTFIKGWGGRVIHLLF